MLIGSWAAHEIATSLKSLHKTETGSLQTFADSGKTAFLRFPSA